MAFISVKTWIWKTLGDDVQYRCNVLWLLERVIGLWHFNTMHFHIFTYAMNCVVHALYLCTCTCIYMYMYVCMYIRTFVHLHVHAYMYMYMYVHMHVHTYICTCMYNYIFILGSQLFRNVFFSLIYLSFIFIWLCPSVEEQER